MADTPRSVEFFESQFQRQVREQDFAFNPFETVALDFVSGDTLDLGCGLGNLALAAARRGCRVTAIDASPTAMRRIRDTAATEALPVAAVLADLETYVIDSDYDTIVAIGLLMFFRQQRALELLEQIRDRVRPGGKVVVNVLVEGTTYLEMFDPDRYHLFGGEELLQRFADWNVLLWRPESFHAPRGTVKEFRTIVAERPSPSIAT